MEKKKGKRKKGVLNMLRRGEIKGNYKGGGKKRSLKGRSRFEKKKEKGKQGKLKGIIILHSGF